MLMMKKKEVGRKVNERAMMKVERVESRADCEESSVGNSTRLHARSMCAWGTCGMRSDGIRMEASRTYENGRRE